jgi:Sigma-70, region 4
VPAALARLAAIDHEIIELASWDGLTPREIAPILGLSPDVVRVRFHRARARLTALLQTERVPTPEPLASALSPMQSLVWQRRRANDPGTQVGSNKLVCDCDVGGYRRIEREDRE